MMEKLLDLSAEQAGGVEVEWKSLKDILVRTKGTKITAGQMKTLHKDGAPLKIFAGGKTVAFVDYQDIPEKNVNREPSIIVKSRGVIEFEYYEKPFSHKNEMWSYHSAYYAIHIKFVYYFLKLNEPHFQGIGGRMQMPQIATPDTDKFLIPIPCPDNQKKSLEIQAEIVRILDAFTELTTELTTELNLRKKQYNYYRDQLLSFDLPVGRQERGRGGLFRFYPKGHMMEKLLGGLNVEWPLLGYVTKYEQPTKYLVESKKYNDGFSTPVLTAGKTFILGYTDEIDGINKASVNPVIIFDDFTTANKWVNFDFKAKSSAMKMITSSDKTKFSLKYVYYWLNTLPSELIKGDHKRQWISNYSNKKIPIPCPDNPKKSLEIQAEIIRILDKFNSLTEGLPREIELRKKQYEYYRDQLLSFASA
jgi:type I restriction enzyme S subunit